MMFRCVLALVMVFGPFLPRLSAQVDQDHWIVSEFNSNYNSLLGLQQEFTPSLNEMDSAQFSMGQGIMGTTSLTGGAVALNIRQGGVNGPVIAASSPVVVPPVFRGDIVFRFARPVPLIPGQLYVMEPANLTEGTTLVFDANALGITPGYDRGRLFFNGQFQDVDLIFREGIGIPEPPAWILFGVGVGLLGGMAALRSRRFGPQLT